MSKSHRRDWNDDYGGKRIRHNEKDVNKIRKHRSNLYKYSSGYDEDDDYDEYDTNRKY